MLVNGSLVVKGGSFLNQSLAGRASWAWSKKYRASSWSSTRMSVNCSSSSLKEVPLVQVTGTRSSVMLIVPRSFSPKSTEVLIFGVPSGTLVAGVGSGAGLSNGTAKINAPPPGRLWTTGFFAVYPCLLLKRDPVRTANSVGNIESPYILILIGKIA